MAPPLVTSEIGGTHSSENAIDDRGEAREKPHGPDLISVGPSMDIGSSRAV
jgi:hypothetical protein